MSKATILLIEDDDVDAMSFEKAFAVCWQEATLVRAPDGSTALEMLDEVQPKMVILDLSMPGLHGSEVLTAIKKREDLLGMPVIVCSGSDAPEDIQNSYKNHANAYTIKPDSIEGYRELVVSIKAFWDESAALQTTP